MTRLTLEENERYVSDVIANELARLRADLKEARKTILHIHTDRVEMRRRVGHFAGQLDAWGYVTAAEQVRTEILTGPVEVDGEYLSLLAERDALRAALQEIVAHHVEQNRIKGRDEAHSHTLWLARAALEGTT